MPKRILFIISNMETGGVSKAMTSLLAVLDRTRVTPELLIVSPHGALMPLIPDDVHIYTDRRMAALTAGVGGLWPLVRLGRPDLAVMSAVRMALMRVSRCAGARLLARLMPRLKGHWDAIVDFNGQHQLYYMARKIEADRRATFFHSDYRRWRYYERADRKFFGRVDAIFTISNVCVEALREVFPEYTDRIAKVENVCAPGIIARMAAQTQEMPTLHGTVLMTLGHITHNKGADLIIEAAERLHNAGVDFTWMMVGAPQGQEYITKMSTPPLDAHFRLIGVTANPYPYLRRHRGTPLALRGQVHSLGRSPADGQSRSCYRFQHRRRPVHRRRQCHDSTNGRRINSQCHTRPHRTPRNRRQIPMLQCLPPCRPIAYPRPII